MTKKLEDYEHVLKVIRSCVTNAQNQTAYRMVFVFNSMYKNKLLTDSLVYECDDNLVKLIEDKRYE